MAESLEEAEKALLYAEFARLRREARDAIVEARRENESYLKDLRKWDEEIVAEKKGLETQSSAFLTHPPYHPRTTSHAPRILPAPAISAPRNPISLCGLCLSPCPLPSTAPLLYLHLGWVEGGGR